VNVKLSMTAAFVSKARLILVSTSLKLVGNLTRFSSYFKLPKTL